MGKAVTVIAPYLPLVFSFFCLIAAWRFGDWRNWPKYYSAIIFTICVDFMISLLLYNHSLWYFHKAVLAPNHTVADFLIAITNFPPIVLLYLSRYPYNSRLLKQFVYISVWVGSFVLIESIFLYVKLLSYHNGWTLGWSILVWISMFLGLRLHDTKPLWAWIFCLVTTVFLIIYFKIPISTMK